MAVIRRFVVAERSMAPTLEPGDRFVALTRPVSVGAVVAATSPDGLRVVKRVAAIGPATVAVDEEELAVDGRRLPTTDRVIGSGRWHVGPGSVFLLSDAPHRTLADSRTWGPLPASAVDGVAVWRYRPLARFGRVG